MDSKPSVATGLALMLETACEDFEIMQKLISHDLLVVSRGGQQVGREPSRIIMALGKSFVFHLRRARRIFERGAALSEIDRHERKLFMARTSGVVNVRDVNEHGYDPHTTSPPSLHPHEGGGLTDETAMMVGSPELILMGPLNLFDLYGPTDRMRRLAGFRALAKDRTISPS